MSSNLQDESSATFVFQEIQTNDDHVGEEVHIDVPPECIQPIQIVDPDFHKEVTATEKQHIPRIPPHMRGRGRNQGLYDPVVLSIGPYHHGKPQFRQLEEYKEVVLNSFMSGSQKYDKAFFGQKILQNINKIKRTYEKVKFSDEKLADIILRDACFVVNMLEKPFSETPLKRLPLSTVAFIDKDIYMLENQIPFWVIMFLLEYRNDKSEARKIVRRYLSLVCCNDELTTLPWENGAQPQPLHLLEAFQLICTRKHAAGDKSTKKKKLHCLTKIFERTKKDIICCGSNKSESNCGACQKKKKPKSNYAKGSHPFRSVTHLRAHGICFEPRTSCLKDIRFTSYPCSGKLQLPVWFVSPGTKVFFSNIIAFEMSQECVDKCIVASYINFMKSLIENAEDVKELREKEILFSSLGNEEDVVKLFKELNTYGLNYSDESIFAEVRGEIDEHCNSMFRTLLAEFIDVYFRRPWTVISLLAAGCLLILTFIQTF